jgi:hypothetical protein
MLHHFFIYVLMFLLNCWVSEKFYRDNAKFRETSIVFSARHFISVSGKYCYKFVVEKLCFLRISLLISYFASSN